MEQLRDISNIPTFQDFFTRYRKNEEMVGEIKTSVAVLEKGFTDFQGTVKDGFKTITDRLDKTNGSIQKTIENVSRDNNRLDIIEECHKKEEENKKTSKSILIENGIKIVWAVVGMIIFLAGIILQKLDIFDFKL